MAKKFSKDEQYVCSLFSIGASFSFLNTTWTVINSGKPRAKKGEPKTDIYVLINSKEKENLELKISFKKKNADFLENKITVERAKQIFGEKWKEEICKFTETISENFINRKLIYKEKSGKTSKGSFTLGWRFEFVNKSNGSLSGEAKLEPEQVYEIYAGTKLDNGKRNSTVNGVEIVDSGIANYMLLSDIKDIVTIQDAVDSLVDLRTFAANNSSVYFVCKALNYRSFEDKIEGNRLMSVFIDWAVKDGKLSPTIVFDQPLVFGGKALKDKLKSCLKELDIKNTDDITLEKVSSFSYVNF